MTAASASVRAAIDLLSQAARRSQQRVLAGKVLGLVGYDPLGREIAREATRCGMDVIYADVAPRAGPHKRVLLGELLQRSDYVLLLRPPAELPGRAEMRAYLKPGAMLLSIPMRPAASRRTARGASGRGS